ncbi:MAG TPA: Mut7-C RNAse domain-containing protein [Candidatus Ozemobacteraceae bacterium]|nr:Mut7-C RNAse domain-containing protein [Candidatus Ozemobacteraceae bacterium]
MIKVTVRFYEELNDFIRAEFRKKPVEMLLENRVTVQDLIASFGVPHTGVDLILVNGDSVGFCHRVHDGDMISIYPVFESFDVSGVTRLQKRPLRNLRFIVDSSLGELAGEMRLLGLDVEYRSQISDDELVAAVVNDRRVLLSRDHRLLMRKDVDRGYLLRSLDPVEQLEEVIIRFDLWHQVQTPGGCTIRIPLAGAL